MNQIALFPTVIEADAALRKTTEDAKAKKLQDKFAKRKGRPFNSLTLEEQRGDKDGTYRKTP